MSLHRPLWYLMTPCILNPSTSSTLKTPDPQSPGPSTSLVETEENPGNTDRNPVASEPAAKGDIQVKYSFD